jgi:hypothetical protein
VAGVVESLAANAGADNARAATIVSAAMVLVSLSLCMVQSSLGLKTARNVAMPCTHFF